jgi:hypothetical protein
MILSLLFSCATQSINGDDTAPVGTDDTSADADADADADTDTDSDTDPVVAGDTIGKTYSFSLDDATISKPAGMGTLLDGQLTQSVLLEVQYADETSMDLMLGLSLPDEWAEQDYCVATSALPGASFAENPSFNAGPTSLSVTANGITLSLDDLYLSGTFAADLSEITNGKLSALLDTRPLDELAQSYGVDTACELLAYIGASCIDCPDGNESCVEFEATKMLGKGAEMDLEEIQGSNCDGCESGVPAADAVCY